MGGALGPLTCIAGAPILCIGAAVHTALTCLGAVQSSLLCHSAPTVQVSDSLAELEIHCHAHVSSPDGNRLCISSLHFSAQDAVITDSIIAQLTSVASEHESVTATSCLVQCRLSDPRHLRSSRVSPQAASRANHSTGSPWSTGHHELRKLQIVSTASSLSTHSRQYIYIIQLFL